jgi:hypothetical protein
VAPETPVATVAGADAITPVNPIFGAWELIGAKIAPWWDKQGEEPAPDPALAKMEFRADRASGPPLLTCAKPHYVTNMRSARGLFEGNLPNPNADATALGFQSGEITTVTYSCTDNATDVSVDFPMIDDDKIMLGVDNVLYTFGRTG